MLSKKKTHKHTSSGTKTIEKIQFGVSGMGCNSCATRIENTLAKQKGVEKAFVNFSTETAIVIFRTSECTSNDLKIAVENIGYHLHEFEPEVVEDSYSDKQPSELKRAMWALFFCLLTVAFTCFKHTLWSDTIAGILSGFVVFGIGLGFHTRTLKGLCSGFCSMDTLITLGSITAYIFSVINLCFSSLLIAHDIKPQLWFESSAVIIAFALLGRAIEARAKFNTTGALRQIVKLQPKTATIIDSSGHLCEMSIERIRCGQLILVKPGERIAVDGTVTQGESNVDESLLSGEPFPVTKRIGSKVYAGTMNENGVLQFVAEELGSKSILGQIIHMVSEAIGSKAPIQRMADRISAVFVPMILLIATIGFVLWLFLASEDGLTRGLLAFVTTIVISCPCAMGLATPTAVSVGIGRAAHAGILIKNAESLETAKDINIVVWDKTGTLTEGKPQVSMIEWENNAPTDLSCVFRSLELCSTHPLSKAICKYFQEDTIIKLSDIVSVAGKGIIGTYNNKKYFAGNKQLIIERGITISKHLEAVAQKGTNKGSTLVFFADENQAWGVACIDDCLRETATGTMAELKDMNIETHLLTGDHREAAERIAKASGITEICADLLPMDKANYIQNLQKKGKKVCMVGDGINDSIALAQANISIALGSGSDVAMSTADMTIIGSDPRKVAESIRISKATMRTIRQNLFWAFIYNIIAIPIATGILYPYFGLMLNPMIATVAMALSSLSVVINSLRLRHKAI